MCVIEHNVLITLLHFPIGLLVSSSNFSSMEAMCIKQDIRLWLVLNHYPYYPVVGFQLPRCGFPIAPLWVSNYPIVGFQLPVVGFQLPRVGFQLPRVGFQYPIVDLFLCPNDESEVLTMNFSIPC